MSLNPFYVVIVLVLGVLFFGKNLPAVAKQIGSSLMEFRKGLDEWKEEIRHRTSDAGGNKKAVVQDDPEECFESLGTKFEPPSGDV